MGELLAKSGVGAPTVCEHCFDVREAGDAIWSSVAADLRDFSPGLTESLPVLRAVAELLHDVLKANSSYQNMVASTGRTSERQPVRHEILAAAFLTGSGELSDWFATLLPDEALRWAVVWAVAGHHFKMTDPARSPSKPLFRDANAASWVMLHLAHKDVSRILAAVAALFGKSGVPALKDVTFVTHEDELRDRIDDYVTTVYRAWSRLSGAPANKALVAVMKALVIAADAAGSAITERGLCSAEWVSAALGKRLTRADLEPVVQRDLKGQKPRTFQQRVADSPNRVTVVAAGCGNGKTTAAYLWAQKWANGKKLFFTYPTTGTATAGYIGYLSQQDELLKDLIHGRSEVDLAAIRGTREDEPGDELARIESLRAWSVQVVNCTVDTVLGLLQTQRRSVYSFPAFAASAFVFDEIHAYDAKLWGGLLRFLKEFPGVPALLMSASIPPGRMRQLDEVLGDRAGELIRGDDTLEGHKRYCLESRPDEADCWSEVAKALSDRKKVLWVCNTVGDAIRVAREAVRHTDVTPIVYHSRFRYRDRAGDATRKGRQQEVVDELAYHNDGPLKGQRVKSNAALVIATQVCEMSLDISADLLVTAECPLPALVQRLGRLNRYATADDAWPCLVYPFSGLPYNEDPKGIDLHGNCIESMKATRDAVKELAGQPCSQKNLALRLEDMSDAEVPDTYSALFDDGWVTEPMPVRDGDQSITVIRAADLDEIGQELGTDRKRWPAGRLAPWTIPMNLRKGLNPFAWDKAGPYPLAPTDVLDYSEQEGAQWVAKGPK